VRLNQIADDDDYDDPSWRRYCEPEITTRDVADLLGVTQATVRRWVARGYISPIGKLGPSNVFRRDEVLDAHEQIEARQKATGGPRRVRGPWFVEARRIDRVPAKHWDSVLSIDDAAKLIEVSPATIRSWIHRGHLTPLTSSTRRAVRLRGVDVIRAARGRHLPKQAFRDR
jgi:excisionase family DNA binding protein